MQSDPEEEFEEILLKARAPMAAIAQAVTGSDSPDAWTVELEPRHGDGEGRHERRCARPLARRRAAPSRRGASARAVRRTSPRVAAAVRELLLELGGDAAAAGGARGRAARALIEDPRRRRAAARRGDGERSSACSARAGRRAIHVPGRYALIQDLWVAPAVARPGDRAPSCCCALFELARERGIARVEVGLPSRALRRTARRPRLSTSPTASRRSARG